jgi:2,3-bisphosphoglycerate-dependent phosphoglycerate mutase
MHNLILIRHGQSQWNLEKRFTGFYDAELTNKGKLEAKYAGQLIKKLNISFDSCFTSQLQRAKNTLSIILETLNQTNTRVNKAWELNERHYGELTGLNKDEIIKKHGVKQVKIWRRSYNVPPPPMHTENIYKKNILKNIPENKMPASESLKNTFERVVPYYLKNIEPLVFKKKNILVVFHGNSCRALLKKIFNISNQKIIKIEIPTGNPLLIRFDKNFKVYDFKYLDKKRSKKIIFKK